MSTIWLVLNIATAVPLPHAGSWKNTMPPVAFTKAVGCTPWGGRAKVDAGRGGLVELGQLRPGSSEADLQALD